MPSLMFLTIVQFCFLNKISSFPSFDGFVTSGPGLRKGQITISNRDPKCSHIYLVEM